MSQKVLIRDFPNELVLVLSGYLPAVELYSLIITSRRFSTLLLSRLRTIATKPCNVRAALYWAVITKNRSFAKYLLENGEGIVVVNQTQINRACLVDSQPTYSQSTFYRSPAPGDNCIEIGKEILDKIMEKGSRLLLYDEGKSLLYQTYYCGSGVGYEPLDYAVKTRHHALLRLLLGVDSVDLYNSALKTAVPHGTERIVGMILTHAKVTFVEKQYKSLVRKATSIAIKTFDQGKAKQWVQFLLPFGGDLNGEEELRGLLPLHHAALRGQSEVSKLLLDNGAEVDSKSQDGRTALHYATLKSNLEVAQLLLEHRADINHNDSFGNSTLHLACDMNKRNHLYYILYKDHLGGSKDLQDGSEDLVRLLLKNGADINARDSSRRTPLHLVAWKYTDDLYFGWENISYSPVQVAIIKLLKEEGVDTEAVDNSGDKPLEFDSSEETEVETDYEALDGLRPAGNEVEVEADSEDMV